MVEIQVRFLAGAPKDIKMFKLTTENSEPTIFGRLVIFGLACITMAVGAVVFFILKTFAPYSLFVLGLVLWWVLYSLTIVFNGGDPSKLFYHFKEDVKLAFIPGYAYHKTNKDFRESYRNTYPNEKDLDNAMKELSKQHIGLLGFIDTHLLWPFLPLYIYMLSQYI